MNGGWGDAWLWALFRMKWISFSTWLHFIWKGQLTQFITLFFSQVAVLLPFRGKAVAKARLHYMSQTLFISEADTSAVKDQLSATMCDMGE